MASVHDHLRELSVLAAFREDLKHIDPQNFHDVCKEIQGFDPSTQLSVGPDFSKEERSILLRGQEMMSHLRYKLGLGGKNLEWLGFRRGLFDISIDGSQISLKENSLILKNSGFYSFLNNLLGDGLFSRGLHAFEVFAPKEHQAWFSITLDLLSKCSPEFENEHGIAYTHSNGVYLVSNQCESSFPLDVTYSRFMAQTNTYLREKVFSKWIKNSLQKEKLYLDMKAKCSEAAGANILRTIEPSVGVSGIDVLSLVNLGNEEYYYAKHDGIKPALYRVPTVDRIGHQDFYLSRAELVGTSQLNLVTEITNHKTGEKLELLSEIRYTHGQFNNTPEAKVKIKSNINAIYEPL